MKRAPLVATLTLNPGVDLFTSVDRLEPTRKLRCSAGARDPGGGGINVARVVQRLGAEAVAVYPIGGAVGQLLHELVGRERVRSVVTPIAGETREDVTVLDRSSGQQYRFVMPGPHLHGAEWMACLKALAGLPGRPDLLCASGSLPPGAPTDFYVRAAEIAAGWGAKFVLDAAGPELDAALDTHVHLIKPNLRELIGLVGPTPDDERSLVAACRTLIQRRRVEAVALTLGERGALLVTRRGAWRSRAPALQAISTVGAGDSFLGGMVAGIAAAQPLTEAFRQGAAAGAAAVLSPGTELCRAHEVRRLLPQITLEDLGAMVA